MRAWCLHRCVAAVVARLRRADKKSLNLIRKRTSKGAGVFRCLGLPQHPRSPATIVPERTPIVIETIHTVSKELSASKLHRFARVAVVGKSIVLEESRIR